MERAATPFSRCSDFPVCPGVHAVSMRNPGTAHFHAPLVQRQQGDQNRKRRNLSECRYVSTLFPKVLSAYGMYGIYLARCSAPHRVDTYKSVVVFLRYIGFSAGSPLNVDGTPTNNVNPSTAVCLLSKSWVPCRCSSSAEMRLQRFFVVSSYWKYRVSV
jgi:hypothetical protein